MGKKRPVHGATVEHEEYLGGGLFVAACLESHRRGAPAAWSWDFPDQGHAPERALAYLNDACPAVHVMAHDLEEA